MVTFRVDKVTTGTYTPNKYIKSDQNLNKLVGLGMEASSEPVNGQETYNNNNFMAAINTAYGGHLPLELSPDTIWLAIAQGLSLHINNNAEELRHQFVNFEGKKKIEIFENSFRKGSPDNNWSHAFMQFSDAIKDYIGKKRDLIVGDYSTTTPVTRASNEIVLMEAMQRYFTYECTTMCGIPEITLLGTVEDWKSIKGRVQAMAEFNLSWWTSKLEPIVDEFIAAAGGKANKPFWQNIYKEGGGSGGPYIAGWSTNLFPYLRNHKDGARYTLRNEFSAVAEMCRGLTTGAFPNGIAKVPFIWNYYTEKFDMELSSGFTGFKVENNVVTPNIGWAVRDTGIAVDVTIVAANESDRNDYSKREEFVKRVSSEATKLGLAVDQNRSWRSVSGVIPKNKLQELKQIVGAKVLLEGEDE